MTNELYRLDLRIEKVKCQFDREKAEFQRRYEARLGRPVGDWEQRAHVVDATFQWVQGNSTWNQLQDLYKRRDELSKK